VASCSNLLTPRTASISPSNRRGWPSNADHSWVAELPRPVTIKLAEPVLGPRPVRRSAWPPAHCLAGVAASASQFNSIRRRSTGRIRRTGCSAREALVTKESESKTESAITTLKGPAVGDASRSLSVKGSAGAAARSKCTLQSGGRPGCRSLPDGVEAIGRQGLSLRPRSALAKLPGLEDHRGTSAVAQLTGNARSAGRPSRGDGSEGTGSAGSALTFVAEPYSGVVPASGRLSCRRTARLPAERCSPGAYGPRLAAATRARLAMSRLVARQPAGR